MKQRKPKVVELKEIKFRLSIEQNDYLVKLKMIQKFLNDGNKVKVSMRFRGREMAHQEHGLHIFQNFKQM